MSSCDLIFKLEQETDKLKMVIFRPNFRVIIRPSDLQKLTKLYISTITRMMSSVINNKIDIDINTCQIDSWTGEKPDNC